MGREVATGQEARETIGMKPRRPEIQIGEVESTAHVRRSRDPGVGVSVNHSKT